MRTVHVAPIQARLIGKNLVSAFYSAQPIDAAEEVELIDASGVPFATVKALAIEPLSNASIRKAGLTEVELPEGSGHIVTFEIVGLPAAPSPVVAPTVAEVAPTVAPVAEQVADVAPEVAAVAMSDAAPPSPEEVDKAEWSTAYINTLPDSAFLYVEPGGEKDGEGKTVPRSLRHFPIYDADGKLDLPHLRNALARIPQSKIPGLSDADLTALTDMARELLEKENEKQENKSAAPVEKCLVDDRSFKRVIAKAEDEQYVFGVVLEPLAGNGETDAQNHFYDEAFIEKAFTHWTKNYHRHKLMHREALTDQDVILGPNFLAPFDYEMNGEKIKKGTWLQGNWIPNKTLWQKIKNGEYNGYSIGGFCNVIPA